MGRKDRFDFAQTAQIERLPEKRAPIHYTDYATRRQSCVLMPTTEYMQPDKSLQEDILTKFDRAAVLRDTLYVYVIEFIMQKIP